MRMSRLDADIRCRVYQRFCIGWRYAKVQRTMKRAEWNDWLVMLHAAKSELDARITAIYEPPNPLSAFHPFNKPTQSGEALRTEKYAR